MFCFISVGFDAEFLFDNLREINMNKLEIKKLYISFFYSGSNYYSPDLKDEFNSLILRLYPNILLLLEKFSLEFNLNNKDIILKVSPDSGVTKIDLGKYIGIIKK